jgi:hypothetical protein
VRKASGALGRLPFLERLRNERQLALVGEDPIVPGVGSAAGLHRDDLVAARPVEHDAPHLGPRRPAMVIIWRQS